MVLESTMICLDNSEWMRNGDYTPSRLAAQQDTASLLCSDRTNSNPENTVGILTMAGQGVDLLVSPTEEISKILAAFAKIRIGGKSDLTTAVQISQLALKHRKNKNGGQRIIAFVGAPVFENVDALQKIGKQLKKNNVAIDVVSFGETSENNDKLTELINAANSNDNSHLITVPAGVSPVNALISSPIIQSGAGLMPGMGGGAPGGTGEDFSMYGGIDPTMDPELAMAIRVSMEEERAQEEARMRQTQQQSVNEVSMTADNNAISNPANESTINNNNNSGSVPFGGFGALDEEDEESLIQKALEMSMQDMQESSSNGNNQANIEKVEEEIDEEEDRKSVV